MKENKKILIVDDSKVILIVMKKFFESKGYEVVTKTSAIDGAKVIKRDNIDLVITDINMPEFSGYDFLLWIRKNKPEIKVIIMTAFGSQDVKKIAMKHGCISYFEKKSNYDELNTIIENILYDKNFNSSINEINLFEFFHLIILSNVKKFIKITDKNSNIGAIYFEPGKIVHAKYNDLIGEEALYNIMSISNGEFCDVEWEEPEINSINIPFEFLIMNIAQRIDETRKNNSLIQDSINKAKNKDILVVDDDTFNLRLIERYLSKKKFSITVVDSPIKCIQMLKSKDFGLIISDINMPEMSGIELMTWVRENISNTKFILMSGQVSESHEIFSSKYGIDYIDKPINLEKLEMNINKLLNKNNFSGNIQNINIFDFIQIISMSKKDKVIDIKDKFMNIDGKIYIKNGHIIHVEFDSYNGEDAFFEISKVKNLVFNDLEWIEPRDITINIPLNSLLIKNFNRMDKEDKNVLINLNLGNKISTNLSKLEKILEENDNNIFNASDNFIDETGRFLGITISKSNKNDVLEIFNSYGLSYNIIESNESSLVYDNIGIIFNFNEQNVVEEMTFTDKFEGTTLKGLSIDDLIDKALELYGKPEFINENCSIWPKMSVIIDSYKKISSITIGAI
ncbi:MAG: response regulator [Candidatus Sericytochromatia bacterium]